MADLQIPHPPIATVEAWREQRLKLLTREKQHTKDYDSINAERRRLPMFPVKKSYTFDTPEGEKSLLDLFEGRTQLIVYHFMFDPEWDKGCPGCTSFVDALGDLSLLSERDTTFVLISRAPLAKLLTYKAEKGWSQNWYSSYGCDFNYDFHATLDEAVAPVDYNFKSKEEMVAAGGQGKGEAPGLTVFFRLGDEIYQAYACYARGLESLTDSYRLLDVTPYGRQEDFEDSPEGWPQKPTYG